MQAQVVSPEWPVAFYLQAAALFSLGMDSDAVESLKDGMNLEAQKHRNWRCIGFFASFSRFIISCMYSSLLLLRFQVL